MFKMMRTVSALALLLGFSTAHAAEFKVGSDLPLTGALARVGIGTGEGIAIAADIFNRTNGKHTIKLMTIDNESAPAKAVSAVEKLVAEGAVAITGGYGTNIISPASEAAEKLGKVYVTSGGISAELVSRGLKNFFRLNGSAGYSTAVVGLVEEMKITSASIVYSTKEATESTAREIEAGLKAKGVKVTTHPFDAAASDFKPMIHKVKMQDKSEALIIIGYENDYVGVLRAAKVLKPESVKMVIGVWSLATTKMWQDFPDIMNNVVGTSTLAYPAEFKTQEEKEFSETYQRLYNKAPDYLGIFGYVQARVLFEAIGRAADKGTLDKGGLADEIRNTEVDSLIGKVKFGANGDNMLFAHRMGQHQDGKIVLISPASSATGKAVFPGVPWK